MALIYEDPYDEDEVEKRRRDALGLPPPTPGLRVQQRVDERDEQDYTPPNANAANYSSRIGPSGRYYSPVAGAGKKQAAHWGNQTQRGGTDIFAPKGTAVFAMRGGTVVNASYDDIGGYNVLVRGDDGLLYYYAHMGEDLRVKPGAKVEAGARLGSVSDTGNAKGTGDHLHLGVGKSIKQGTGPEGGVGTEFDLLAALEGAEDEARLRRPPDATNASDLDNYDETTGGLGMTGLSPADIAEIARREQERAEMAEAARRRARWQDMIGQNIDRPYQFNDSDEINWWGR